MGAVSRKDCSFIFRIFDMIEKENTSKMTTISVKNITKPVNQTFSERNMTKDMIYGFEAKVYNINKRVKSILIFYTII